MYGRNAKNMSRIYYNKINLLFEELYLSFDSFIFISEKSFEV